MDNRTHDDNAEQGKTIWKASIVALVLGLMAYGFFVLIDHENWFHMRIGSGTAQAMSQASDGTPAPPAAR